MEWGIVGVVAIALLFFAVGSIGPLLAQRRLRRTRPLTATEREQLDGRVEGLVAIPHRRLVIETVGDESIEVAIRGPPGYRVLFVTDYVLHELEPTVARALLCAEAARSSLWYREYQVGAASVAIGLGAASLLLVVPFEAGFGALLVAALVMFAGGRRLQYRADAKAAEAVGAEPLADAFETVALRHGADLDRGGWRAYLEVQPRLGDRIHRLREAA